MKKKRYVQKSKGNTNGIRAFILLLQIPFYIFQCAEIVQSSILCMICVHRFNFFSSSSGMLIKRSRRSKKQLKFHNECIETVIFPLFLIRCIHINVNFFFTFTILYHHCKIKGVKIIK